MRKSPITLVVIPILAILSGCTIHPAGERAERRAALDAGKPFEKPPAQRLQPPLPNNPTAGDLVRYALLSNAGLEARYWEWRAAIERIPQEGTQSTDLALSAGVSITNGSTRLENTTFSLGNDPMSDIVLPTKLGAAARRALENARAAGKRFRKAQFDLRAKVLNAYTDYALTAQLIRLEQSNAQLLQMTATITEAKNEAGSGSQQDLLKARNELDLSRNDIATMEAQLPAQRAALNALLDRSADAALPAPAWPPPHRSMIEDDRLILALAARQNPELAALAHEIAAGKKSVALAKLQYLPNFSLTASTDLAGVTQSLLGMITVPLLRHEAIDAAIAQAQADLRATEAMRRQTASDLGAQVVMDLSTLRDADRQLDLLQRTILPRAQQAVTLARSSYEAGSSPLLDLLDAQRSLIALHRLIANLQALHEKRLADLEAVAAGSLVSKSGS